MWLPGKGRVGFGIDFAVRTRPPLTAEENNGTVGEFFWDGAASTLFWVDPVNKITAVLFTQLMPFDRVQLHKKFRDAIYGAIDPIDTEKSYYKPVADQFEQFYNNGKYDGIFAMFSSTMKNKFPLDNLTAVMQDLQAKAGNIKTRNFQKYVNGNFAVYKTQFDKMVFDLYISVDNESRINGLSVQPLKP